MGKSAGFAQQEACFSSADGQKRLFCPTRGLFFVFGWAKVPVSPNGSVEFPASGPQNGLFWGTKGRFSGLGTPKWHVLGYEGVFFRAREPKKACFGARRYAEKAEAEGERDNGVTGQRGTGASGRPEKGHQGKGAPPPEYTRYGGYGAGAAGGSGEGPPRARLLPEP